MDNWQVAQNYLVAAAIGGAVGGYYYYTSKKPNRTGSLNAITTRRSETDLRGRNARRSGTATPDSRQSSSSSMKKRKPRAETQIKHQPSLDVIIDEKPTKESDISTAQFANQMQQARQGTKLQTTKSKDTRLRTVKPRSATNTFDEQSQSDEQDGSFTAGDVSDMLEPAAPAPHTLRITAPSEPQKTKVPRQAKEEVVETKKQRQHRKKAEERKALREEAEQERKVLEERQRRSAREARGEPAKNGLAAPSTAWKRSSQPTSSLLDTFEADNDGQSANRQAAQRGPTTDTFDAESTSSSNGGPGVSTAATSTTSSDHLPSEEEQIAAALKQSGDESGWTVVNVPAKKTKKSGTVTPVKKQGSGQAQGGAYAALGNADWEA